MGQLGKEHTHQEFWQLFNDRFSNSEKFENAFNKRVAWEKVYYDLAWGNPDAHVVVRHLMNDHKFKLEIYIEDEKQSGLFKKLESYKEDIQHEFEEPVVFTPARMTGNNTDSKARIIYIEKTDIKESADDEYWIEQIDWIQAMSLKLKGVVDMYGNDKKYSVNDSVWIAAAILAYEKYKEDPEHVSGKDMYFKQSKIVKLAQNFTDNKVDNARVSWWVNADNEKHTQNYLRADLKEEQSLRRLSMMDEFEEKSYPLSLEPDVSLSADEKNYLMKDLLQFVSEVYPSIIEKMLMELEINYKAVLDYLENNQEIPYSNPEATGITEEKRNELLEIKQRGQDAVAEMKKMANRCNELYGLDKCIPGSWLDGSNTKTRKYLWTQMKYKEYEDNPISVSLFVEKNNQDTRYRISLEIKNDGTDKQTMAKYHSYLDIPVESGMVFVAGSNEWGNPAVIEDTQESIKEKVESGELKKVQLCIYIEPETEKTNQQYNVEIMEAVKKIIPYYEYVIGKAADGHRAWLLTWNPANWQWEDYKEQCTATKHGNRFTIGWTCSSKQPEVGDELFLIKTGDQPRGIIAHGYVSKAPYISPHYDPEKAKQGITSGHIDAEYDWIQDYELEAMLLQDDLKEMFPAQQWSPMGSGIEIKNEYVGQLDELWKKMIEDSMYWPPLAEYNPGITSEQWAEFVIEDSEKYPRTLEMLIAMLENDGKATCKHLSQVLRVETSACISRGSKFGRRAANYFGVDEYKDNEDNNKPFVTCFVGRYVDNHLYEWKLRDELKEALEMLADQGKLKEQIRKFKNKLNKPEFEKNMILFGPPGTGKTYNSANYAVAICDGVSVDSLTDYDAVMERYNQLKSERRIAFTTFHQSYGYEEFIEGIKPIVDDESKDVSYTIEPGVFKRFCEIARCPSNINVDPNAQIWFMRLEDNSKTRKDECFANGELTIEIKEDDEWSKERFVDLMQIGDYVLSYASNSVFIDAIGVIESEAIFDETRNTYQWFRKVKWHILSEKTDVKSINDNTYLPNFSIAKMNHMKLSDLLRLLPQETEIDDKPYVFVIDEINRGNISKIFGELITLIENTKREGMPEAASAILPYSGQSFSVPTNVYILGTMNTADRSIALMDTALRRRFQFEEMMPNSQVLRDIQADTVEKDGVTLDVAEMLDTINQRIEYLYDREHTIGHAFFTGLKDDATVEKLASIFMKSVIPLLQEYFYEDYSKIMLVLGDNGKKDDEHKFILAKETKANAIFRGDTSDIDIPDYSYEIQKDAFYDIMSYVEIKG